MKVKTNLGQSAKLHINLQSILKTSLQSKYCIQTNSTNIKNHLCTNSTKDFLKVKNLKIQIIRQ